MASNMRSCHCRSSCHNTWITGQHAPSFPRTITYPPKLISQVLPRTQIDDGEQVELAVSVGRLVMPKSGRLVVLGVGGSSMLSTAVEEVMGMASDGRSWSTILGALSCLSTILEGESSYIGPPASFTAAAPARPNNAACTNFILASVLAIRGGAVRRGRDL